MVNMEIPLESDTQLVLTASNQDLVRPVFIAQLWSVALARFLSMQ